MIKFITILLLPLVTFGQIAEDKKMHFNAGLGIGMVGHMIFQPITKNKKKTILYSVGLSFAAGLTKELIDKRNYGVFDAKDLLATTLGGIAIQIPIAAIVKKEHYMY